MSASNEVLLAEEQAVRARDSGRKQEVEAEFGFGTETEGTLVLTNARLIYVHSSEEEVAVAEGIGPGSIPGKRLAFSDVEQVARISPDPANFSIALSRISSVKGHKGVIGAPRLEVVWNTGSRVKTTEFVQQVTGGSRVKNLDDWKPVIERLMAGKQTIIQLPPLPAEETDQGRVIRVMGDMQEQGILTLTDRVNKEFMSELDFDGIQAACEELVKTGLLERTNSLADDPFYRRKSPLGEDDLFG